MAFIIPFFSNVRSKSHCAVGIMYDIVVDAKKIDIVDTNRIVYKSQLYFPNPVAVMAVSKSAASSKKYKEYK